MFDFQSGDILFQGLECGPICDAIEGVTHGYKGAEINHCGLVVQNDELMVVEAIAPRVSLIRLSDFLSRSRDEKNRPRIMVGRVRRHIEPLISNAVSYCIAQIGVPYDPLFSDNRSALYCSELIIDGFEHSNNGEKLFPEKPMTFRDPRTGEVLDFWNRYFEMLQSEVPEGVPGSNPATLSCDPHLAIVAQLGSLKGAIL